MPNSPDSEDRRDFIRIAVIGGIGMLAAGVGAASVFTPPKVEAAQTGAKPLIAMIKLGAIETGKPLTLELDLSVRDGWRLRSKNQRVYVVRVGEGETAADFKALNPTCSHAGCTIEYHDKDEKFICPCHDAQFEPSGKLIDGPAPRDMDAMEVSVGEHQGAPWLFVKWQDFVVGTAEQTPRGNA